MYIGIALIVLIVAAMAILIAAGLSFRHGRASGAPFYLAKAAVIRRALKEAGLKPGELFYDLGAGTGRALVIAEKEFGAAAKGFEISLFVRIIARMNLFLHGVRAELSAEDLFRADLRNADVVFCFLAVRSMARVEDILKTGLKPGARVVIYAFPLPTMTPVRTITIRGKWGLYVYNWAL